MTDRRPGDPQTTNPCAAELEPRLQAKLLRFLQERTVQRVGEDVVRTADVRVICATNRDPFEEVECGRFRQDLFYRLYVVPILVPPLRRRREDIIPSARRLLLNYANVDRKRLSRLSPEVEAILLSYNWPGNSRELDNVMRGIVVLHDGEVVEPHMLPPYLLQPAAATQTRDAAHEAPIEPLDTVIRNTIERALNLCGGSVPKAAAALQVSPSTLYRRLENQNVTRLAS